MARVHIGHHFFGAGNVGDDFMLAGFLAALASWRGQVEFTCCVPHPREPLARRFPEVRWLPYTDADRRTAIAQCDAWLGLGGSPFQCDVSRWFVDHLAQEHRECAAAGKPMFFLGVGGQDPAAYALPEIHAICADAVAIWLRDPVAAERLAAAVPSARVTLAADLAHVFFSENPPPSGRPGRLTAVLNFDYAVWPGLDAALAALDHVPAGERVWLAQESRPLPGAEQWLYERLSPARRAAWRFQLADDPATDCRGLLARWPHGEWLLSSRYHATLAGAWAGTRTVVLATNDKLRSVAVECGCLLLETGADVRLLPDWFRTAPATSKETLKRQAEAARNACAGFARALGLTPA